jgi:predicted small lipoprotein YifL
LKSKRFLIVLCLVFVLLTSAACGKKGPPTVTKINDCRLSVEERGLKDKKDQRSEIRDQMSEDRALRFTPYALRVALYDMRFEH